MLSVDEQGEHCAGYHAIAEAALTLRHLIFIGGAS
jgi:hypothetical protein